MLRIQADGRRKQYHVHGSVSFPWRTVWLERSYCFTCGRGSVAKSYLTMETPWTVTLGGKTYLRARAGGKEPLLSVMERL